MRMSCLRIAAKIAQVGVAQAARHGRHERRVFEVGPVEAEQVDAAHAEGRGHRDQALGLEVEVVEQDRAHVVGRGLVDREPHHRAEAAAQHALLDRLEQVVGLELLDRHLGVARHAEGVDADDRHAGEELVEVGGDELLEPDEVVAPRAWPRPAGRPGARHGHQARQRRGHLDAGEELLAVLVAQQHRQVEAQVGDVRERAGRGRRPAASAPGTRCGRSRRTAAARWPSSSSA